MARFAGAFECGRELGILPVEGEMQAVRRIFHSIRIFLRATLACALIVSIFSASTGIVLFVAPSHETAGAEWYPCIGHQCGCRDAASCRAHCCCAVRKPVVKVEAPKKGCCPSSGDGELLEDVEEAEGSACHVASELAEGKKVETAEDAEASSRLTSATDSASLVSSTSSTPPTAADEGGWRLEIRSGACSVGDVFVGGKSVSWIAPAWESRAILLERVATVLPARVKVCEPEPLSPPVPPPRG